MKLIENWRVVARRSHSMWAIWLGITVLLAPDVIYRLTGWDTNPRLWFLLALVLLLYGAVGRLIAQGIDHSKTRSPIWVALLVIAVGVGGTLATADRPAGQRPSVDALVSTSTAQPVPEAFFLLEAVPLVAKWEGLRTAAYLDPVGVWTVCYGETVGVKPGDRYTEAECAAMLGRRILDYRAGLHRALTPDTLARRLPVSRDAAYTSLTYNIGVGAVSTSTAVRRLNAGDVPGGCEAIGWWNKAGGRVLRGLVNRRAEEVAKCMEGVAA